MKKLLGTIAVIAISMVQQANAQTEKGLYISLNGGYGFSASSENIGVNYTQTSTTSSQSENVYGSFGKGMNFGGAIGYNFNSHIGAEIGLGYRIGSEIKNSSIPLSGTINETVRSAKMFEIKPTLVISAGMKKINPYAKFGLLLANAKITENKTRTNTTNTNYEKTSEEFKGGMQLGFQGGIGSDFMITEKIAIFAELNLTSLTYKPTESEFIMAESSVGGVITNDLTNADIIDIKTIYEDSSTSTFPPAAVDVNSPSKSSKFTTPFGSFGFNIGVKYNF
jgi:outer membrane protein W